MTVSAMVGDAGDCSWFSGSAVVDQLQNLEVEKKNKPP